MIWWVVVVACSSAPEVPTGPDPAATAQAVDNLCKLYEGARLPCERGTGSVTADGVPIQVVARYDQLDESLGVTTFKGTVTLTTPGHTWTTRMNGYGSRTEEALQRGLHEWALVDGTAFVDALRGGEERLALAAVEPGLAGGTDRFGDRAAYRGWSLMRPPLEGGVPHEQVLMHAAKALQLDDGPHALRIEVGRNLEKMSYTCYVDGQPSEPLCGAVQRYTWPEVRSYEIRQTYVLPPKG